MADHTDMPTEDIIPTKWNRDFEKIADNLCPDLQRWRRFPQRIVRTSPDEEAYFGLRLSQSDHAIERLPSLAWGKGEELVLDFGLHMVGYLSMKVACQGSNMDAPCRLRLTFGESLLDVTMGMDDVNTWISTAWLPDEVINIDMCPESVSIPRRHAFRYLRIQVIDTSLKYKVSFSDVQCECVSAISQDHPIDAVEFKNTMVQEIDHACISTLRDCMQTVFEDGPRRDRRLWSGDLRLQALANYSTFRDYRLVKHCIFRFAAVVREDGSLPACIFEKPHLSPSTDYIVDYDALFSAIVFDYVAASGDLAVGHDLWPTVMGCVKRALSHVNPDTHVFEEKRGDGWKFLDWAPNLDHSAGFHGVLLFCLKAINKLAKLLGISPPFLDTVDNMSAAAQHFLSKDNVFISGPTSQISYASAAWLLLAEAFPPDVARSALLNTIAHPDAIKPLTPYLWHHVCDALVTVGCNEQCLDLITDYWGGMIRAGADTFWECYDPNDPRASPYGDVRNNSFCHAWSCTPTYLLRSKLGDYVKAKVTGRITMGELDERWITRSAQ
ncbi:Fc.00g096620.m01.CDS01 [Cosmosporella sp. VM-42]